MKFNLKRVGIIALCVIGVIMSLILFFSLAAFYILLCIAIVVIPVLLVMNAIDAWECHSYSTVTHTHQRSTSGSTSAMSTVMPNSYHW